MFTSDYNLAKISENNIMLEVLVELFKNTILRTVYCSVYCVLYIVLYTEHCIVLNNSHDTY